MPLKVKLSKVGVHNMDFEKMSIKLLLSTEQSIGSLNCITSL